MELVHGRSKAFKSAPVEDVIGSMPENVITNIMDRLLLHKAVRTSILSRNWRFKWTLLSQLVFDYDFFEEIYQESEDTIVHFDGKNISRLLLHLKGTITNFVLDIPEYINLDDEDINHWIIFLCRIGIKKFTLINEYDIQPKLPAHIFSCLELKHLKLHCCFFGTLPCFRGFPNLLSLDLYKVRIQDYKCGNLIARSPLLEILSVIDSVARREVKLAEIVKLENLRKLCLSLCLLDDMTMTRPSNIFHQISLLPKLQNLYLRFGKCKFLAEASAQTWVSTTFPCLKSLTLHKIDFSSDTMLSCVVGMLSSAPNLQILDITAAYKNTFPPPLICSLEGDCSTIGQLQLQEVVLTFIKGLENEFLAEADAQTWVYTTFPCLKTLRLHRIDFSSDTMLACVVGMLSGAPNLQTLDITAAYQNTFPPPLICSLEGDCSTIGQLQLQNVELKCIKGLENEVCLIKSMLACSPLLGRIVITPNKSPMNDGNEKFKLASKLLKLHRASPIAEICFH